MKIVFKDGIGQWSETEGYDVPSSDKNPIILRYAEVDGKLVDQFAGKSNDEVIAADIAIEAAKVLTELKENKIGRLKVEAYEKTKVVNEKIAMVSEFGEDTTGLEADKVAIKDNLLAAIDLVNASETTEDIIKINI